MRSIVSKGVSVKTRRSSTVAKAIPVLPVNVATSLSNAILPGMWVRQVFPPLAEIALTKLLSPPKPTIPIKVLMSSISSVVN